VVHGRLYVQYAGRHAGHPYGGWYVAARLPHGGEVAVAIRSARGGPFEVQLAPGVYQMGGMHWVLGRGLDKRLCDARTITIREGVAPRFLTIRCKIG